ncbi:drebrin-like protein B isoform X2 [Pecten maximus]|uniref:drebrin-like protein B isoform X2 n=1 Tax=Pecten maximus TaxID=6579 RepID=UPI001458DA4A|nr:drebrin-like protein B isoform X2 [Pecten maximus]
MALDMRKNQDALIKAYRAVVDDKSETDWVIFGYEGQSSTLKLIGKGDEGIGEMVDDLNSSKIMYAYCKVMDPNTNLPKYVLINWQGEAAPESMKFKCANHVRDVSGFLKPVHVTIQARSEDDVDEDIIVGKVSKASGANYSIHDEKPKKPVKDGPVGSVYKRVNIANEINTKNRDDFWAEAEKQEAEKREAHVRERMKSITEQRKMERRLSQQDSESEKQQWEKEQVVAYKEETERGKRSELARKERAAEASKLTTNSAANARALFRRKESESMDEPPSPNRRGPPPPPKKLRQPAFLNQGQQQQEPKKPINLPTENMDDNVFSQNQTHREPSPPPREPSPPPREPSPPPREPSPPPREPSPPPREPSPPPREPSPEPQQPVMREPSPTPQQPVMREPSPPPQVTQLPRGRNLLAEGLPRRQDSDEEEEEKDDDWDDNEESAPVVPSVHADQPHFEEGEIEAYQQEVEAQEEAQVAKNQGQCARALYDYQASDETEITFDPDDILTNIDQIDPGWWMGTDPSGKHGMFPANYVELM